MTETAPEETDPEKIAPEETAPEETDPGYAQRLAAGTGGMDFHYTPEDLAAQAAAAAVAEGDPTADFAQRLAQGTGGMDFYYTEADKAAQAAYAENNPPVVITEYVEGGLTPEQSGTIAGATEPGGAEPQSPSQPGPTPGEAGQQSQSLPGETPGEGEQNPAV